MTSVKTTPQPQSAVEAGAAHTHRKGGVKEGRGKHKTVVNTDPIRHIADLALQGARNEQHGGGISNTVQHPTFKMRAAITGRDTRQVS